MTAFKRTRRLGRQPLPPFAKSLTLVQVANNWLSLETEGVDAWPEGSSIFNVACLALFRRGIEKVQTNSTEAPLQGRSRPLATTFWTDTDAWPGTLVFSRDRMVIPNGAEFFSVGYAAFPDNVLGNGVIGRVFPYPEEYFRLTAHLSI